MADHTSEVKRISDNLQFHSELNPKIWERSGEMKLEVRIRLLRAAISFYKFLDVKGLRMSDIVVTGSNAAFNYTTDSDVDVHLVVDYANSVCPSLAENFFNAKKNLWNSSHDITIRGMTVELYVEDARNPAYSNGLYSLLNGAWLRKASREKPRYDDAAVIVKTEHLASRIDDLIESGASDDALTKFREKLRTMRRSGLRSGGEFSVENLTYKALRSLGYIDLLYDTVEKNTDLSLSLGENIRA